MLKRQSGYPFSFDPKSCDGCGAKCCRGPRGFIWLSHSRAQQIARSLSLEFDAFSEQYLRVVNGRLSLREVYLGPHNFACIALDLESNQCTIYENRPDQCLRFPFWEEFRDGPQTISRECPGITPNE